VDPRLTAAVRNNADWCDAVCRSHGIATARADGWWFSLSPSPTYYPDAVTLSTDALTLPEVLAGRSSCSVKDSFAALDLVPYGFEVLFDARWIHHEPVAGAAGGWRTVTTAEELTGWTAAHGDAPALGAELLDDPDVRLLSTADLRIGLVANRSRAVVGLSNVFGDAAAWTEPAAVGDWFPGLPLVGWEHGEGLEAAASAGWDDVGRLRVWLLATHRQQP
jgi:hypothetical protein